MGFVAKTLPISELSCSCLENLGHGTNIIPLVQFAMELVITVTGQEANDHCINYFSPAFLSYKPQVFGQVGPHETLLKKPNSINSCDRHYSDFVESEYG